MEIDKSYVIVRIKKKEIFSSSLMVYISFFLMEFSTRRGCIMNIVICLMTKTNKIDILTSMKVFYKLFVIRVKVDGQKMVIGSGLDWNIMLILCRTSRRIFFSIFDRQKEAFWHSFVFSIQKIVWHNCATKLGKQRLYFLQYNGSIIYKQAYFVMNIRV